MSIEKQVWDKAHTLKGRNPEWVRQDPYGYEIHRNQYGRDGEYGWDVYRIKSERCGGGDDISNLRALKTKNGRVAVKE